MLQLAQFRASKLKKGAIDEDSLLGLDCISFLILIACCPAWRIVAEFPDRFKQDDSSG